MREEELPIVSIKLETEDHALETSGGGGVDGLSSKANKVSNRRGDAGLVAAKPSRKSCRKGASKTDALNKDSDEVELVDGDHTNKFSGTDNQECGVNDSQEGETSPESSVEEVDSDVSEGSDYLPLKHRDRIGRSKSSSRLKALECGICHETLTGRIAYKDHQISVHNKKYRLNRPPQRKKVNRTFTCNPCSKEFSVMKFYMNHMKDVHKERRPFKCQICFASFSSLRSKERHSEEFHNPGSREYPQKKGYFRKEDRMFVCFQCKAEFPCKSRLEKHVLKEHVKVEGIMCEYCGKTLSTPGALHEHMKRLHDTQRPFRCEICDRGFPTRGAFRDHWVIHESEPQHICDVCGKTFSRKRNLVRHLDCHLDSRKHECPDCGKTFKQKTNMTMHRRIHLNERPFHCTVCGKTYTQSSNLKSHMKTHEKEERKSASSLLLGTPMDLVIRNKNGGTDRDESGTDEKDLEEELEQLIGS